MTDELKFECLVSDREIRAWMDAEIARLGELFKGFEITWCHYDDFKYSVDLWSETKNPVVLLSDPHGHCLTIGTVFDRYGFDPIEVLQREGRKLYHQLKKDYPVRRILGRKIK